MSIKDIYDFFPTSVQNALISIKGFLIYNSRFSKEFHDLFQEVIQNDQMSQQALDLYQKNKFYHFFYQAKKSPFWNQLLKNHEFKPGDDPLRILDVLPILSKTDVQRERKNILISEDSGKLVKLHTSGTTGAGLVLYESKFANSFRWAVWWRYRTRFGIKFDDWSGHFGGRSVVPASQIQPPYWRINYPGKQLLFSAYHLSDRTACYYLDEIKGRKIRWLHGYPSFLALLADYSLLLNYDFKGQIKFITTGAENLLEHQKRSIEKAFGILPVEHYGLAEGTANISQCKYGNLHIDEDYSLVELIPTGNQNEYKLIGTNFLNFNFPLFRYDCGDLVTYTNRTCSCGLIGRVIDSVDGRKEDYLILKDGSKVGRLDHLFKDVLDVKEAQFYQQSVGYATLFIVKNKEYGSKSELLISDEIKKWFDDKLEVEIKYLDSIKRTNNGKLRFVVSNLINGKI
jgi:phenylacetate-CoA ligase